MLNYYINKYKEIKLIIIQIYTGNSYRNFNYLVGCEETGEAIAIDPLAYKLCLDSAKKRNWTIKAVINTHEHLDHIGGNSKVIQNTGAKLYAHKNAKNKINGIDIGLCSGDIIKVGKTIELEVIDTPGHTMSHICLLSRGKKEALFSGDTLFNAGVGNCHNGGDPEVLYETFFKKLYNIKHNTIIYPGHDYIENNLNFSLNREPSNLVAKKLLKKIKGQNPNKAILTDFATEIEVNSFFRLENPTIINELQKDGELRNGSSPKEVFLALRKMRNSW